MKNYIISFLIFLFVFPTININAQTKRKKLEKKRLEIIRQINQINLQLNKVNKNKISALEELSQIKTKLNLRQNLINGLRKEINGISNEIKSTEKKIEKLRIEVEKLKKTYANLIRQSYNNRSRNSKMFFLFSSNGFYQAFKRMQYLKQYSKYRKQQAEEIEERKDELEKLKINLEKNKQEKQKLFGNYQKEKQKIVKEQQQQIAIVNKIKKQGTKYIRQIRAKERQKRKIDRLIEKEIRKAIVKSNKKSGRNVFGKSKSTKFFLTPKGKKLADEFSSNRGVLPWPVKKAYITKHFGIQRHPIFKNVRISNSGIDLATEKGASVIAVFAGKVLQIQIIPGGNTSLYIKHGNYLTIYQNLKKVFVKPGDNVKFKQKIGVVATDPTTGKTTMKFMIYKNLTKLNPEEWLMKKY